MTKHTLKDFLDGRICVRCANQDDKQRLLQLCDDNGISKVWLSTLDIQQAVSIYNVFFVGESQTLTPIADAASAFCSPVPFSSLINDRSLRSIVIEYSDTTTTATLYNGEKAVKSATINRRTSDNPSVHIAAVEAIDRLLAKQAKQPKPKKPAVKNIFNVGDRVVINAPKPGNMHMAHGKHGTIVSLENEDYVENTFAVELDEPVYGHNCAGITKPGHGCYVEAEHLLHEQPAKSQVREVKRRAKVGEYVKITKPAFNFMQIGDVVRVSSVDLSNGSALVRECDLARPSGATVSPNYEWVIFNFYVVLEGYQPEGPANA